MKTIPMSFKKMILIIWCLFICLNGSCQTPFAHTWYGSAGVTGGSYDFIQLPDSTYLLSGVTYNGGMKTSVYMRCNSYGDSLYTFKYDSSGTGPIALLNDSEIITPSLHLANYQSHLSKVNFLNGDTILLNIYPSNFGGVGCLSNCSDNGYIFLQYALGPWDFMKVDSSYNLQWNRDSYMSEGANSIKPDPLGCYIAVGNRGFDFNPYAVQRLDSAGNIIWNYGYGNVPTGALNDFYDATDVAITDDSNYIVSCKVNYMTYMKINYLNGDTIWTKIYPDDDALLINNAGNDRYVTLTSGFDTSLYFSIALINGLGNYIWKTRILPTPEKINQVKRTLDGGFAICGGTKNSGAILFIKYDSLGNTVNTAIYDIASNRQVRIYPNPASDVLNFAPQHSTGNSFTFSVYDLFGNNVRKVVNQTAIDVTGLTPGVYVAEVREGDKVMREKFVKE